MNFNKIINSTFLFIVISIVFIIGVSYISWRWIYTLNLLTTPFSTFWSYALLFAELLTLAVFTNFSLILLKTSKIRKIVIENKLQNDYLKDVFYNGELITFKNYCPSVDIFICTINETPDMLSTTISACMNIIYPNKKVYVLDDGRREEIKRLTEIFGCSYITRDTNKGFKAGNINNALLHTNGEIIVIFDADHVPASTFLKETVYNFVNEKLALVQTPQHFCNPDAFQKNLKMSRFLSNEQEMFYRVIEPSLNEYGSVFCGGTNILIRRSHLNAVGNFPETTITEDSLLGLEFHSEGYQVLYYNRPIAIGLAASSFEEYIKQRCRWAKGNIQIVMNRKNWHYYSKLTPIQTFFYLSGVLYFFTPLARLIFLLAPVLFLFYDISPVLILFYQIFAFQICYFSIKFAFIFTKCLKIRNVIFADVYDLVTSIFTIGTIFKAIFIPEKFAKTKFSVTKKDVKGIDKAYKYVFILTVIFIVLVMAEMEGVYNLFYSEVYSELAIVANLFWNSLNIIVLYFGIKVVSDKPEKREYQRIRVRERATIENVEHQKFPAKLFDASRSGVSFFAPDFNEIVGDEFKICINDICPTAKILQKNTFMHRNFYKSIFVEPLKLLQLTKEKVDRIDKFVKIAYKCPDLWDDYFDNKGKSSK